MPQLGPALRMGMALLSCAMLLAACGQQSRREAAAAAAPVRRLAAQLSSHPKWRDGQGKCLCVGLYREETVEDFPAGLLEPEFARHPWLHKWSECEPYYARAGKMKGCSGGMVDFVCSVSERTDLPRGISRVLCHVSGTSEALQKEGYLQDEYDVTLDHDGQYVVNAISLKGTSKIHE